MGKFKILNFQNLLILNTVTSEKPFDETKFDEVDTPTVAVMRDPYAYFDQYLEYCITNEMSSKLKKETRKAMKTLNGQSFLKWFETLHYLPLVNPQTFQIDMRKRVNIAIENLESFDYVVPYEELDVFVENVAPDLKIKEQNIKHLPFSLSQAKEEAIVKNFIEKDVLLYQRTLELWEVIKNNDFEPLNIDNKGSEAICSTGRYDGIVGILNTNSIAGWVMNLDSNESVLIGIYKNNILLEQTIANGMRPDIQQNKGHSTGLCGFKIVFETPIFQSGDTIEVKTIPDNTSISLSKNVKIFLGIN